MCFVTKVIEDLHEFLTGSRFVNSNIIRKHSTNLDKNGDISFPLNINNWRQCVNSGNMKLESTILDVLLPNVELNEQLNHLVEESKKWTLLFSKYELKVNNVHLYLDRFFACTLCIHTVLQEANDYGFSKKYFENSVSLQANNNSVDEDNMNLTDLRICIIQSVGSKILNKLTKNINVTDREWTLTVNSNFNKTGILCGPILNESGVKDTTTTAKELYKKRAMHMQLMAQHKYGVRLNQSSIDFTKLGKDAVILEMLQNKISKPLKIRLNCSQTTIKDPSFIFYNYARIYTLLRQFEEKVLTKIYPELPSLDKIQFSLLNQPEEWEIMFVFILQFPVTVFTSVSSEKDGSLDLHKLVLFLSNLSSVFSVYYRRVKILIQPKEHLLPMLFARIYLIKVIEQVFYNAMQCFGIEPIKHM